MVDDSLVHFSFLEGSLLYDLAEGNPIKFVKLSRFFADNASSSWGIVHKGELTEGFSLMVSLQICLLAIDDLRAVKFSTFHDEELISILSFLDNFLSNFVLFLRHGFD